MALYGVDIAGYQSMSRTRYASYAFVIVKATEGCTFVNSKWRAQVEVAIANGQLIGVYHYCRPEYNSPEAEAKHFFNTIREYVGRVVLGADWEQRALRYSASWLLRFMREVERLTGTKPLLYIQQSAISGGKYNSIADAGYPLWMAQYNKKMSSRIGAWKKVTIWQYTSTNSTLDKDVFFGDRADWYRLINASNALGAQKDVDSTQTSVRKVKIVGATKRGMNGVQVKGLQEILKGYGYYKATVDGDFGAKTEEAVKAFQKAEGLAVDGIAGKATWSRLAGLE
jgi:lysozyme